MFDRSEKAAARKKRIPWDPYATPYPEAGQIICDGLGQFWRVAKVLRSKQDDIDLDLLEVDAKQARKEADAERVHKEIDARKEIK